MKGVSGKIFDIERFATEDGPGIRTVIFLKGCVLRCKWCANPESQSFKPEIMYTVRSCKQCGRCIQICPQKAISSHKEYGLVTDKYKCTMCNLCVDNCYYNARKQVGIKYTVEEIIQEILKDEEYYKTSQGGVTFSGGEPFWQDEFIGDISKKLKQLGISVLVETCGHVPLENIQRCIPHIDYIYYDIKHMDSNKHRELTGFSNELIIRNLKWLDRNFKGELTVRYPYIPGCNDKDEDIREFLKFANTLEHVKEVEFLPYHRLGLLKYEGLAREYAMKEIKTLKKADLAYLLDFKEKGEKIVKIH